MKFNENHPKGFGDRERTQNSRVNLLTCYIESRLLGHVGHHLTKWNIRVKINENHSYESDRKVLRTE